MKSALQNSAPRSERWRQLCCAFILISSVGCAGEPPAGSPEALLAQLGRTVAATEGGNLHQHLSAKSQQALVGLQAAQKKLVAALNRLPESVQGSFLKRIPAPLQKLHDGPPELFAALCKAHLDTLRATPRDELLEGFRGRAIGAGDQQLLTTRSGARFRLLKEGNTWRVANFDEPLQMLRRWSEESLSALEESHKELQRRRRLKLR